MQIHVNSLTKRFSLLSMMSGLITAVIGLLIILAWRYNIPYLKTFGLGELPVAANTGLCFFLSGIAITLFKFPGNFFRMLRLVSSVLVLIIGFITLMEMIFPLGFSINEILLPESILNQSEALPARMAINTTICMVLIGTALLLLSSKNIRISYFLIACIILIFTIGLIGLFGYLFGHSEFSIVTGFKTIAAITIITFLLISSGLVFTLFSKIPLKISIDHKIFAGILFSSCLVIFITLLSVSGYSAIKKAGERTNHSQNITNNLNKLLASVLDIESGVRAYLISNNLEYLELLSKTKLDMVSSEQNLKVLLQDNKPQLIRLDSLNHLIGERIEHAELIVSVIQEKGETAGLSVFFSQKGKDLTDEIRSLILRMKAVENKSIMEINETEIKHSGSTQKFIFLNLLLEILLISFIFIGIRKFIIQRNKAIQEYLQLNEVLEDKVADRTSELVKSEERLSWTLENMMEGCQLIGFDWAYIYINETAEKHNRRPKSDLIGKIYMEMWPGIESTEVFARIKDCMVNRVFGVMENEFIFPDETSGWFDLRIQPAPEGVLILSTDITEHVWTEKYNKLSNEILEHLNRWYSDTDIMISSILETIRSKTGFEAVGIRIKSGMDYPYYKTLGFSDEFIMAEKHLCYYDSDGNIRTDQEGNPLLECMCGNILSSRVDPSKSYFTEGGSFRSNNTTWLLANTSDEERLVRTRNRCTSAGYESVALIPLRSGNEIIGLLQLNDHRKNIFRDDVVPFFERIGSSIGIAIMRNKAENELKCLNEELEFRVNERTEQLLDSNKELESFAYSVSHDLRAPLRHVIGFSEILENELAGKAEPEINRLTGKIKNSASRMGVLIDELLTYSRLGRTEIKKVTVSLNPVIDDIIREAGDQIGNRNIEWKINKLPDVKADLTLVKLLLQNLIYNAIKFTSKKPTALIEINFKKKNKKECDFYIKDNGAGFNMDYVNKLFGVFQRLHSNEEFEGTGIGLATVRRIVKRLGGTVWAEGTENEGATFYFTLRM